MGSTRVGGDVDAMASGATSAYGASEHAGYQSGAVQAALAAVPPVVEVGPAADQLREFGGQLQGAMRAVAQAYEKVSAKLRVVAAATDAAQQADRAAEKAKAELASAQATLSTDEGTLLQAQEAPAANTLSVTANPLAPPPGPTPAQTAAISAAAGKVKADEAAVREATETYHRAEQKFQELDEKRKRQLAAFSTLCLEEAAIASRAIPQAPANILDIAAVQSLGADVNALLDLPLLADSGFATAHPGEVQAALGDLNATRLQQWTDGEIAKLLPKPTAAHHSGLLGDILHGGLHFLDGVWDGTKSLVTGVPSALAGMWKLAEQEWYFRMHPGSPPPPDPLLAIIEHPGALIGLHEIEHDPAKGLGELVPTILLTLAGVGAETKAAEATEDGTKAFEEATALRGRANLFDKLAESGNYSKGQLRAAQALEARIQSVNAVTRGLDLQQRAEDLKVIQANIDRYDKVSGVAGVVNLGVGASQGNQNDLWLEGKVVGKATELGGKALLG